MKTFYNLLFNAALVATKNNFVWFALTYWAYLETKSVISTGLVGGIYLLAATVSSFWFGSIVDHYKKKQVMIISSFVTLGLFVLGLIILQVSPSGVFTKIESPFFWLFIITLLLGAIAGNIVNIAVPTLITRLVPAENRDKANGLFGTAMGVSFAITSVASGIILGSGGMVSVLVVAISITILAIAHLWLLEIPENKVVSTEEEKPKHIDIKGTIAAIGAIPGLFALIFFTTFNNFVGGVFMALMDAYGLSLVSVQVWGMIWGVLSFGFIFGGLYIAKNGLGKNPLKGLFKINIIIWATCIFFPIQPSIVLLAIGALIWMSLIPFVEATEQTIIQKVVPAERQGRVFGFAQSVEQAASPITAFLIGPIAQLVFIPFMTTGRGVELIGNWFGVGEGRGMALVFMLAGLIGLLVTLFAMRSNSYKLLAKKYSSSE